MGNSKAIPMEPSTEYVSLYIRVAIYFSYVLITIWGIFAEWKLKLMKYNPISGRYDDGKPPAGYARLWEEFDYFYIRQMYRSISDCWNRPICSMPGAHVNVMHRTTTNSNYTYEVTGESTRCLNLGSYNYLGFAQNEGPINDSVVSILERYGSIGTSSPANEAGTLDLHKELEAKVARFIHKEDALVFGMGYLTNSTSIPAMMGKGDLVISDTFNHASLVVGCKQTGATVKPFKHNDMEDLERVLKEAMSTQTKDGASMGCAYKRIMILVEGVYSMEGNVSNLPGIVALKKKYKAYLYVDEAHSIGAMGNTGRGVIEYWGINPDDVDIMMGTFTKSFGSVGGYIAGSRDFISYLRRTSFSPTYCESIPAACTQQILAAFDAMCSPAGIAKIKHLHDLSNYFRESMRARGFVIFGAKDSPVVPMMIYLPSLFAEFSRECLKKGIATVVVAYPATPMDKGRARFCISASHTLEDIQYALEVIDEIGDKLDLKFNRFSDWYAADGPMARTLPSPTTATTTVTAPATALVQSSLNSTPRSKSVVSSSKVPSPSKHVKSFIPSPLKGGNASTVSNMGWFLNIFREVQN
eukprot:TRINITY_DN348_c0_g1_i1.p1 TRINITY_DN348_c0_g1~~TRINITY_DN348_c0_g1_i1.p1  ORF type:complete len:583 (-),score=169.47 TRINITY_DN348_c0_g1_i1:49-1797(-)